MDYKAFTLPKARRQISSLSREVQERIAKAVKLLREDPRRPGSKKLKDVDDLYRYRVGDYRIIYAISDELLLIIVVTCGHRSDVYRNLAEKYSPEYLLSILRDREH